MLRKLIECSVIGGLLSLGGVAFGGVSLATDSRSVGIQGSINFPPFPPQAIPFDTMETASASLFDQTLTNSISAKDPNPAAFNIGTATVTSTAAQTSTVTTTADLLYFMGSGSISGVAGPGNSPAASGEGSSEFSFTFTIDEPASYQLTYNLGTTSNAAEFSGLVTNGGTSLFRFTPIGGEFNTTPVSGSTSGLLDPGTYTFSGGVSGGGNPDGWNGSYGVMFQLATAVPLPSSILMGVAGLGLSGVVTRRWTRIAYECAKI